MPDRAAFKRQRRDGGTLPADVTMITTPGRVAFKRPPIRAKLPAEFAMITVRERAAARKLGLVARGLVPRLVE